MLRRKKEGAMVDRLRDSLADLDPPTCANCGIEMRWYMSKLERHASSAVIVHSFACAACGGVRGTETEFTPLRVLPDKLLAPLGLTRAA